MKILLADDDDFLWSHLAKELEARDCDVHQSSSGDEAFYLWQHDGPWELVLSDYKFLPGQTIKDGVQLVTAIHGINQFQQMAIMTSDPQASVDIIIALPRRSSIFWKRSKSPSSSGVISSSNLGKEQRLGQDSSMDLCF